MEIMQTNFGVDLRRTRRRRNDDKNLMREMRLNATTKLLQINLLELQLLKFFHEQCTQFFSFCGVDKNIEYVWSHSVPTIFSQSLLVRNAIYLFSALTLWPFYNIDESLCLDKISKLLNIMKRFCWGKTELLREL